MDGFGRVASLRDRRDGQVVAADQIFKAIGQALVSSSLGSLRLESGRIVVDAEGRTSLDGVWAGGDCIGTGEDLTVSAVAQGRDAAESINSMLAAGAQPASAVA
jgi:glutamate synthase (NADPH/NADH) small chain